MSAPCSPTTVQGDPHPYPPFSAAPAPQTTEWMLENLLTDNTLSEEVKGQQIANLIDDDALESLTDSHPVLAARLLPYLPARAEALSRDLAGKLYPLRGPEIKELIDSVCSMEPRGIATPAKYALWGTIEDLLSDEQLAPFAEACRDQLSLQELPPYAALIQHRVCHTILAAHFISVVEDAFTAKQFLDVYIAAFGENPPAATLFMEKVCDRPEGMEQAAYNDWFFEVILKPFTQLEPRTAACLYLHLLENSQYQDRTCVLKRSVQHPAFTDNFIREIFRITSDPESRYAFMKKMYAQIGESQIGAIAGQLLKTSSPALLYLHAVMEINQYILTMNAQPRNEEFLTKAWKGTREDKKFIIDKLWNDEPRRQLLTDLRFIVAKDIPSPIATEGDGSAIDIDSSDADSSDLEEGEDPDNLPRDKIERWSLPDLYFTYPTVTTDKELSTLSERLRKIPPLAIAIGMKNPNYAAWLPRFIPELSDAQIEACCLLYTFHEFVDQWGVELETFKDAPLAAVLNTLQPEEADLQSVLDSLASRFSSLRANILEWENKVANLSHEPGEPAYLQQLKEESLELVKECSSLAADRMRIYLRERGHPLTREFTYAASKILTIADKRRRITAPAAALPETQDWFEGLSQNSIQILSQSILSQLDIKDADQCQTFLNTAALRTDADFETLHLPPQRLADLQDLAQLVTDWGHATYTLNGRQHTTGFLNLLDNACLRNPTHGSELQSLFVQNAPLQHDNPHHRILLDNTLKFIGDKFPEASTDVAHHKQQLEQPTDGTFQQALTYCVHFARTNQPAAILYGRWREKGGTPLAE